MERECSYLDLTWTYQKLDLSDRFICRPVSLNVRLWCWSIDEQLNEQNPESDQTNDMEISLERRSADWEGLPNRI